jgi:benzylsuccinate CoA-transferase BbsF subunit
MTAASHPLQGLRVLDFCWVGAGALVTKLLADLGAEVIKIESRARPDNLRVSPPFRPGTEGLEGSGYFASRNSNKKSFALDMRRPGARAIALDLAAACSVMTSNFRPGVLERWGLSYDDVRARNPSIIYVTMPMQGADGPHSSFIGFGSTISALAGLMHLSGRPDRPPVGTGTHYPDHVPNPGHALVALLAALLHRERAGEGQAIEVSQLESTINVIGAAVLQQSLGERLPGRTGNRVPGASPHGTFRCRGDDAWIAIACLTDAQWRALADIVGHPEWTVDPRFETLLDRKRNEDELELSVNDATRGCDRGDLVARLRERGVPAAPVNSSRDVLEDDTLRSRAYWQRVDHPVIGAMAVAGPPFRFDGRDRPALGRAPLLGEHTADVARDVLGMDAATIDRLVADGILA